MDNDHRALLQAEVAKGDSAQRAFDGFFEPFFEEKTAELFGTFKTMSSLDPDSLMVVKMMTNSLESLRDYIQEIINTGKLASKAINDEEKENE